MKNNLNARPQKGQTLVEFVLVSIIFIFLLVVTFNAVLAFSIQQYLSYATFMSARAYQAAKNNPQEQRDAARRVFNQFIPNLPATGDSFGASGFPIRFPLFSKPVGFITRIVIPNPQSGDYGVAVPTNNRSIGLQFSVPLAELPLGEDIRSQIGFITLETRSFLGREVTQEECRTFFRTFLQKWLIEDSAAIPEHRTFMANPSSPLFMEDNGC